ncbi:chorismate mutase [Streptomyces sp. NPDC059564]|uniref:chorismate mutase n=1 Tax=Streptomyces sp. NPDC059564 TaxID=3346865 RepID=UPI00368237B0
MSTTSTLRMVTATLALTGLGAVAFAACGSTRTTGADPVRSGPVASSSAMAEQALGTIARLAAERVMTADTVAAAKWGTDQPIDDPAREKTVLGNAAARAAELGIGQATVQRIFKDQIDANKDVQRALFAQWRADPAARPTHRPDLATQVRPVLDRVDGRLLTAIKEAEPLLSRPGCDALLERGKVTTVRAMGLDAVHRSGLDQALAHTCPAG